MNEQLHMEQDLIKFKGQFFPNDVAEFYRQVSTTETYLMKWHGRWYVGRFQMDFNEGRFGFVDSRGNLYRIRTNEDVENITVAFMIDETMGQIMNSEVK